MSEGSRVSLAYRKETVWGVKAVGQYQYVNFDDESFMLDKTKERSNRVLPTREYAGLISKTQIVDGGFKASLQAKNADDFFESLLRSSWVDVSGGSGGGTIVAGASGSNLDLVFAIETGGGVGGTITLGSSITEDILQGQVIFISGAPDDANNGVFIVKDKTGSVLTVNSPLVDATYQTLTTIAGDRIRNGNEALAGFSFEREHLDVSKFFVFTGGSPASSELTYEPENPIMVEFAFIGKDEEQETTTASTGTPLAPPTGPEFVVGDSVDNIFIDYEAVSDCLIGTFSLKIDNQMEGRKSIGVFGPCSLRIKPPDVNGSIVMYFEDFVQYTKYINDTPSTFTIINQDSLGNFYAITLSKLEFATGKVNVSGMEDEVPEEHDFMCSTANGFTIEISKLTV